MANQSLETMQGREKHWDELNDKEKVTRMREVVKALQFQVEELHRVVSKLEKHSHSESGQLVVPFERYGEGQLTPGALKNDWF
jgi:hypothetical protein